MDFGTIINRAIKVTWQHKILWVLGFLVALGGGGIGNVGSNPPMNYSMSNRDLPWAPDFLRDPRVIAVILASISLLICILVVVSVVFWIISLIAKGGLIAGVQQIETTGKTTFSSAWSVGANRFWRVLGLNLLISIPVIIIVVSMLFLFGAAIAVMVTRFDGAPRNYAVETAGWILSILTILCCLICLICIVSIIVSALEVFGERAIVLENLSVLHSISRAWQVIRANLGNIILVALVMMVIEFIFGIISVAALGAIFLPTLLPVTGELMRDGTVSGGAAVAAVIGTIAAMLVGAIINTIFITFRSTAWTIAYRQFVAAPPAPSTPANQIPISAS